MTTIMTNIMRQQKFSVMRKRMQVLLPMISKVSYVIKVAIRNINAKKDRIRLMRCISSIYSILFLCLGFPNIQHVITLK